MNTDSKTLDAWLATIVSVVMFLMLLSLAFWPYTKSLIGMNQQVVTVTPLGPVLKATYVGGWGVNTQIDTEKGSFLLHGSAPFPAQAVVELRATEEALLICQTERSVCWRVMGS